MNCVDYPDKAESGLHNDFTFNQKQLGIFLCLLVIDLLHLQKLGQMEHPSTHMQFITVFSIKVSDFDYLS